MSSRLRLLLASFLMLFLELSLIRWSGAEVVHLSYFSNFVLLGSFLGIGLGFLRASRTGRRRPLYSPVVLLALVVFLSVFPVAVNRADASVIYFNLKTSGPPIWLTLPEPEIVPPKVKSERSKARMPLSATLQMMKPSVPPLPICSAPAEIVVPPK